MKKRSAVICFVVSLFFAFSMGLVACGGTDTTNNDNNNNDDNDDDDSDNNDNGGDDSSCATGDNDFYVVENAACEDGAGALSRVNPDEACKETILDDLNCPIDFVLSTVDDGIGYLSSRSDGVFQVNIEEKTSLNIPTSTIDVPTGLALLENLTNEENNGLCGGNNLTDAILFVTDEGTEGSGSVYQWCLVSDDPDVLEGTSPLGGNPSPQAVLSSASDQMENPRGVAIRNRNELYVTAHAVGDTSGILLFKDISENSQATVFSDQFSTEVKDIRLDADGTLLIADPGDGATLDPDGELIDGVVFRANLEETTILTVRGVGDGPRDILPFGSNDDGDDQYLVTLFGADEVVLLPLMEGEFDVLSATDGVTLNGPDGIAN